MTVYDYTMDGYGSFLGNLAGCNAYADSSVATWNTEYSGGTYKCRFYVEAKIKCPEGEDDFTSIYFRWCLQTSTWFGIPTSFSYKIYAYNYDTSSWVEIKSGSGTGYQQGVKYYTTDIDTDWTTPVHRPDGWYRDASLRVYVYNTAGLWVNVDLLNADVYWT